MPKAEFSRGLSLLTLLCLAAAARSGTAQVALWKAHGVMNGQHSCCNIRLGYAVDAAGDVDGDGRGDVVLGTRPVFGIGHPSGQPGRAFAARALPGTFGYHNSQITSVALLTFTGSTAEDDAFGSVVAGGFDLNADGRADVAVGAPLSDLSAVDGGFASVRSGADGSELLLAAGSGAGDALGSAIACIGDASGDGVPDFLFGVPEPGGTGRGRAHFVSGADGALLAAVLGSAPGDAFGAGVGVAGDWNADGFQDFAVGAPGDDGAGQDSGAVRIYSGATGLVLQTLAGVAAGDRYGTALSVAGDVDADGRLDLAVGTEGRYADVRSPLSGQVLLTNHEIAVSDVCGAGDVDQDGYADVAVGDALHSRAWILSGATGTVLAVAAGTQQDDYGGNQPTRLGFALAPVGDIDGDGAPEVLVGAPDDCAPDGEQSRHGSAIILTGFWDRSWLRGNASTDHFGTAVAGPGDIDGDGCAEVLVGGNGYAELYSGRTLDVLAAVDYGPAVGAAGDIDADGIADFAAATAFGAAVFSGSTGHAIVQGIAGGRSIAALHDVDQDGFDDFAIGDPAANVVTVYSGATQLPLHAAAGSFGDLYGFAVHALDDVDGDGSRDLAIGAPGANLIDPQSPLWGPLPVGKVDVRSGRTGALLYQITDFSIWPSRIGTALGDAGDFDGDGLRDLAVGTHLDWGSQLFPDWGMLAYHSGADGAVLWSQQVESPFGYSSDTAAYGYAVAGAGDFDADGKADVVVGNPPREGPLGNATGGAEVRSGADQSVPLAPAGNSGWDYLGYAVAGAGDINGDGFADIVIGAPGESGLPTAWSRAHVEYGRPKAGGAAAAGGLAVDAATLSASGGGSARFQLDAGAAHAGRFYVLLGSASGTSPGFGYGGLHVPLNPLDPYFWLTLSLPSPAAPPLLHFSGLLDSTGKATAELVIPPSLPQSIAGASLHHAFLVLVPPAQLAFTSNAVKVSFVP